MYVPNYIPEPLEVPGNVTQAPYLVRLSFLRRVGALHGATLLAIGAISRVGTTGFRNELLASLLAGCLLALSLVRILTRGHRADLIASSALLPALLTLIGLLTGSLLRQGWPIWSAGVGVGVAVVYAMLCDRDYSFVGQYLLSLIAASVAVAWLATSMGLSREMATIALAWNAAYLFYYVYDLASLQARRRVGEELAAVVDLYRDVFNIFGYVVRVIYHWRKHRIWNAPR